MSTFMREASVEETVEEEIIELVRRDVVGPRSSDRSAEGNDIGSLLQRTSVSAVQEIDHLINELQISRERLHVESARVKREIFEYAALNQSVLKMTKLIAERLSQLCRIPDASSIADEGAEGYGMFWEPSPSLADNVLPDFGRAEFDRAEMEYGQPEA